MRQEQEPRDRSVRASDADRDRTAEVLRQQAGLGRLEPDELEERLEAALSAKTLADLDALSADLPHEQSDEPESRRPAFPFSPLVLVVIALVTVSVLAGHPAFWLFFLLFFAHWRRPAPVMRSR